MNHKTENIFREKNFIICSKTKLIIKNKKQVVEFFLTDISNVRILKRRNIYPNIITFYLILIITSTSFLTAESYDIIFFIINIFIKQISNGKKSQYVSRMGDGLFDSPGDRYNAKETCHKLYDLGRRVGSLTPDHSISKALLQNNG